ncbi:LysR family transcriptional regulator [Pseudonocardiaceae bacterium YIM PH 21723]|nr:LysR family transcriptional regulator [Pseudonocardiaceae bacterium YIM PH 21723]
MDLQQMRYVVAVADTLSFTRAAERCRVVQSALSHQIAKLERELGTQLFERSSRSVRLSNAGRAFLPSARQALDAAERAKAEVAAATGEIRGRLAVGAFNALTSIDVPELLAGFHRDHPHVRIALRAYFSEQMVGLVRDGELDLAFLGLPPSHRTPGVSERDLGRDRLAALVRPDHPLAGHTEVDLTLLAGEAFVDFPRGTAARAQSDEAFAAAKLDREVSFEAGGTEFLIRMVRAGFGVGMLPAPFARQFSGLRVIPVRDAPTRMERLIWSASTPSPAAQAFLDRVFAYLSTRSAE